jgi:hypothetical protein
MSKARNDRESRERRQKEAIERNSKWAALNPVQQLARLDELKLTATKQRAKIAKAMEARLYK